MAYMHFIINPASGNGRHSLTEAQLRGHFPSDTIKVEFTSYRGHASELAKRALEDKPDYVIACGGDGTVNEVASCLISTDVILGILPLGTGNGLASSLGLPLDLRQSIELLRGGKVSPIDVGTVNGQPFFSNMGISADAQVVKRYDAIKGRSLWGYVKSSLLTAFQYRPSETIFEYRGHQEKLLPFLFFISNAQEMGQGLSLTPRASLTDGLLDLFIVPEINFIEKAALGSHILCRTVPKFKKGRAIQLRSFLLELPLRIFVDGQIDGDHYYFKTNKLAISVLENSLRVAMPNDPKSR